MTHPSKPPAVPRLLITMGDVAGIGPEIIAKAWLELLTLCRPVVVGDAAWLRRAIELAKTPVRVAAIRRVDEREPNSDVIPCLVASEQDLSSVEEGKVNAAAGQAAYDYLCQAIDLTMAGEADGIVTAPLHK